MDEIRIIRTYRILQFLKQFPAALVASTYTVYLLSKGLTLPDLSLVALSFYAVLLAAEIPTGVFADRYGRKKSMMVSCLAATISGLVYIGSGTLWHCMLAEMFSAVGCAFYNGALDAWLKHELEYCGKSELLGKAAAQGAQTIPISFALGALFGGLLAGYGMVLPWIVGVVLGLFWLAVAATLMKEHYAPPRIKPHWLDSVGSVKSSRPIQLVCAIGFVNYLVCSPFNLYWQPYFTGFAPDPALLGVLCFFLFGAGFLGAWLVEAKLVKTSAEFQQKAMIAELALIGILVAFSVLCPVFFVSLLFFVMHECPRGALYALRQAYLQNAIGEESKRATIGSIASLFEQAGSITAYVLCYGLAKTHTIATVWLLCGGAAVLAAVFLLRSFGNAQSGQD